MGASPQLQDEEDKRFKRELIAGGVICLFFGIVGFIVQGPDGAANFAWAAFTASAVFLISVDHECSVFASTVIVCCIFGAIGLFVGGINGAFYGAGLAFSNSLLLFSILFVLEQVRSQSSSRKSKALARLPTSPRTQVKPDSTDSGEHRTSTTSVHDPKSLDDRVRLPTPTELDGGTFTRLLAEDLEQMVAEKRAKEAMQKKYPTAMALVQARAMKRVAAKYADLGLARRAKYLENEALSALKNRQSALSNPREINSGEGTSTTKSVKRVIAGPSKIDGGVSRIVEFADGAGRIESWKPGVGWVEGGASADEFIMAAPVSPSLARRLGIPASEL